jgi:hypothetical protein
LHGSTVSSQDDAGTERLHRAELAAVIHFGKLVRLNGDC